MLQTPFQRLLKIFLAATVLLILTVVYAPVSKADLMNPDWISKQCQAGEKEFICNYSSKAPFFGIKTIDSCGAYANNPNYYLLIQDLYYSSLGGGQAKYCFKAGGNQLMRPIVPNNYLVTGTIVLVTTGASFLGLYLIRKKHVHA